ncbi:hypothetical protein [Streptomyces sp. SPB78]|uniref:hypothetical protein n=1 Tax=Streptomyces sp. (strain SPB78) TaxID=591157 RepID=UPI0001B54A2C|nr:hypothetical protein [Streptomyces sp. SPB78]
MSTTVQILASVLLLVLAAEVGFLAPVVLTRTALRRLVRRRWWSRREGSDETRARTLRLLDHLDVAYAVRTGGAWDVEMTPFEDVLLEGLGDDLTYRPPAGHSYPRRDRETGS